MAQLICHHLSVGYDSKAVLTDLNFEVNEQDYLCIVGENGAGKSTLMKTILGLQKPVEGRIMVGDGLAQNEIGYLPQQKASQKDFPASVREIVLSGCQNHLGFWPFYRTKEKKYAEEMMKKLQITHLSKRCYRELSGGQQQRVLLARALCATRKILLLDEPTDHLDMESITALNNGLIKFPGVLLFSSRDHQIVQTTANRIIEIMPNGSIIDKITTYDEYLESDEMARKRTVYSNSKEDEDDN